MAIVVGMRAVTVAVRLRRMKRRLEHPTMQRLLAAVERVQRYATLGSRVDELTARTVHVGEEFHAVGEGQAQARRDAQAAIEEIAAALRSLRNLLA